jgi:GAF domain-containing protein/HAMP domain-containing protein
MPDDQLKDSLEELFSDVPTPAPDPERPAVVTAGRPTPPTPPIRHEPVDLPAASGLTIRGRLSWSFVAILVLLVLSGLASLWTTTRMSRANAAFQREAERAGTAMQIARSSSELMVTLASISPVQDTTALEEEINQARQDLIAAREDLREQIADLDAGDEVYEKAQQLQLQANRVQTLVAQLLPAIQLDSWEIVRGYQTDLMIDYYRSLSGSANELITLTNERQEAAAAQAAAAQRLAFLLPNFFGLLVLIVTAVTAYATIRSIINRVDRLIVGASRLASGNLEEHVPVERQDELGRLATTFNEMADQVKQSHAELEQQVLERTEALQEVNYILQRRAMQLEATAEVGRAITSIFDMDRLLRRAVELIPERFGFYHAGIFLLDETGKWAVLREATGQAGAQMKAERHRLAVGDTSMVGWTAKHRESRIALDVGRDEVRFAHPLLPKTQSEMTLPIMIGERLLGVLNVQSTEPEAFDEDDVRTLQGMADQLAIAIENARRVSDEALLLEAASPIYRVSHRLTTATTREDVADAVIETIAETNLDGCVVVEFEFSAEGRPEALLYLGVWRRDRKPQFQPGLRLPISSSPFPLDMVSTLWAVGDVKTDESLPDSARQVFEDTGTQALANIPLRIEDRVFGQVVVLRNTPGPFSEGDIRLYEALSEQASIAMERVRLLDLARRRAEEEARLRAIGDRLAAAVDLETLLKRAAEELGDAMQASSVYIQLGTEPAVEPQRGDGEERG